ncbi:SUMO-activating enzyme subunit 1 [Entomortierella beljakovae]|nr:SUMO-activating enzyme subunit 1 [Entomortierella beljakovae]
MEHKITEDEAALYDRQIRLWGLEAQHRMRNASILIAGIRALSNEVCKNIILAGVGSITLLEHENVTEQDLGAQFLLREEDIGRNRAEAAAEKARLLNPRVKVIVDKEEISQKPDSYFTEFNVVCITGSDPDQMVGLGLIFNIRIRIDNACRITKTGLYIAGVHGFFGYIFCDLSYHEYREESLGTVVEKGKEPETIVTHKNQSYDSLANTLDCSWGFPKPRALRRKVSPLFFAIQVLWRFQQEHSGRLPQSGSQQDWDVMLKLRDEKLKSSQVDSAFVEDELLQTLVDSASAEISPVCAIVGGFLAQDILKTLSGKDAPLLNYFLYSGIEDRDLDLLEDIVFRHLDLWYCLRFLQSNMAAVAYVMPLALLPQALVVFMSELAACDRAHAAKAVDEDDFEERRGREVVPVGRHQTVEVVIIVVDVDAVPVATASAMHLRAAPAVSQSDIVCIHVAALERHLNHIDQGYPLNYILF